MEVSSFFFYFFYFFSDEICIENYSNINIIIATTALDLSNFCNIYLTFHLLHPWFQTFQLYAIEEHLNGNHPFSH